MLTVSEDILRRDKTKKIIFFKNYKNNIGNSKLMCYNKYRGDEIEDFRAILKRKNG